MYPLKMFNPSSVGFAVANDEQEHSRLTAAGFEPPLIETKVYQDGTEATGAAPLPDESPAPVKRGPGRPRKTEQ